MKADIGFGERIIEITEPRLRSWIVRVSA